MVSISNPVGAPIPQAFIRSVVAVFRRTLRSARGCAVSVILTDRATSRRLNRTYRHVNAPTDVLSFPTHDDTPWPKEDRRLGEVVICYPIAIKQAKEYGHSIRREVAELLIHGLAHLAGYHHDQSRAAKKMAAVESQILVNFVGKHKAEKRKTKKIA